MIRTLLIGLSLVAAPLVSLAEEPVKLDGNWPHWRGPWANGVAPDAEPPVKWDAATNIRWKVPVPGEGSATPIVWQGQVYVVSAVETDTPRPEPADVDPRDRTPLPTNLFQFTVTCFDLESGEVVWKQIAREAAPHQGRHQTNTYASGSPTTDGQRLYVSFGSQGFFAYTLKGDLIWQRDLGNQRTRLGWGEAITPVVHDGSLIIVWDHEDQSFIAVLDAATGETRWQQQRDEPSSWSTPLVLEHGERTQVIVNGTNRVRSYDLATGEVIWECGGQSVNAIPSPVATDDVVYVMSGYRQAAAFAIPLASKGDITDSEKILWSHHRSTPYVPSPIIYGEQLYFTAVNAAIITSLDLETGEPVFGPERLPGLDSLYASPIAAAGRLYFTGRDGTTTVLKHGPQLEVLATNPLGEPVDASPVAVGKKLLLRAQGNLYCIEERPANAGE